MERRLGRTAESQDGLISLGQTADAGLTVDAVRRRRESGRLVPVQPTVYRVAGAPVTWRQRVVAACLAAGPGAVASHRSAAYLWHLLEEHLDVVELTVVRGRLPRPAGVVLHRSTDLVPGHCTVRRGVPVTNPLRTMVDLGSVVSRAELEDALDRGLAARLFTVAAVERLLGEVARRGRRGVGPLRRVLDERALGAAPPDGLLEPRMARLLRVHGLPAAAFQYEVRTAEGRFVARVDFAYPHRRLAIEVDGYACHSTPDRLRRDLARQNALVAEGWTVLRFTWTDVVRSSARVASEVRGVLAA